MGPGGSPGPRRFEGQTAQLSRGATCPPAAVRAARGASESKHTLPGGPTSGDRPTRIEGGGPKRRGHPTFTAA